MSVGIYLYTIIQAHNVISGLSQKAVDEIAASKCSCNQRCHLLPVRCLDANLIAHVNEYLAVTEGDQREFTKVRMSREIFESVELQLQEIRNTTHMFSIRLLLEVSYRDLLQCQAICRPRIRLLGDRCFELCGPY